MTPKERHKISKEIIDYITPYVDLKLKEQAEQIFKDIDKECLILQNKGFSLKDYSKLKKKYLTSNSAKVKVRK